MKLCFLPLLFFSLGACAQTTTPPATCSGMSLGVNGALNGFVPSPNDAWHQDISAAAIDPMSATIISTSGDLGGTRLHPDFTSIAIGAYGIPYNVVDSSQIPTVPVDVNLYPGESDLTPAPIPSNPTIESGPGSCPSDGADHHLIVLDRFKCVAYEYYQAAFCDGGWTASISTVFDMAITEKRPYGYTSADAAGLSIFEGLIRYDEIIAGSINHAIRFTALHTKTGSQGGYFTPPASHAAGNLYGTNNITGMRIRLKASFDTSAYSTTNKIILTAMKKYGMILADNGSNLFFQGTPDDRWDDDDLSELKSIGSENFDVVQMGPIYTSSTVPQGPPPVISSFTASPSSSAPGASVTLTPSVSGASYFYIENAGFTRGSLTVNPTETTTYTLTARNAFGDISTDTTVTVQASGVDPGLTISSIPDKTLGTAPFTVSATSSSPATITFSIASGPATISGSTITLTGAGRVTVQASQAAQGSYTPGTASTSFNVTAASTATGFAVSGYPSLTYTGLASTVNVTALTTGGAVLTNYTGTVTLSSSDPIATLPAAYTFQPSDNGVHAFTVTLNTPGAQSITATGDGVSASQTGIRVGGYVSVLGSTGMFSKLTEAGASVAASGVAGSASSRGALAFDHAGNSWTVTSANNVLNFTTRTGASPTSFTGGGLNAPVSVAVDGQGFVWVANSGNASVSAFNNTGQAQSGTTGYGASGVAAIGAAPSAIAIDNAGGVWIASRSGNSVTHIVGAAAPLTTPNATNVANGTEGVQP